MNQCPQSDARTERLINEQTAKLAQLPPSSPKSTSSSSAALVEAAPAFTGTEVRRHRRLQSMIDARRQQVHRWKTIVDQAGMLAPRLDLTGHRLKARDVRQTMYMYQAKLEGAEEEVVTRDRLLKRMKGSQVDDRIFASLPN